MLRQTSQSLPLSENVPDSFELVVSGTTPVGVVGVLVVVEFVPFVAANELEDDDH